MRTLLFVSRYRFPMVSLLAPSRTPRGLGARLRRGGAAPGGAAELGKGAEEAAGEVGGAQLLQDRGHPAGVQAAGAGGHVKGDVVADGHQLAVELVGGPLGDQSL